MNNASSSTLKTLILFRIVSEACTLICLLVAQRIGQLDILDIDDNSDFNIIIAEAIIEGNSIHSYVVKNKLVAHPYLNTEEALRLGGERLNTLKEWVLLRRIYI